MADYLAHKTAEIQDGAKIGKGTKIWQNTIIMEGAQIGENCNIGHNCLVESDAKLGNSVKIKSNTDIWSLVELENNVFIGPSAVFTNDLNPRAEFPKKKYPQYGKWLPTLVKEGATIGANATIVCGNTIGKYALIGAGAVVTKNIPDFAIVVGVPAKIVGWVCGCGNKIEFKVGNSYCSVCKRKYKKEENKVIKI